MSEFCRRVKREGLLIRLLDKELAQDQEDAVLAHLRDCKKCLGIMANLMLTDAQLKQVAHVGKQVRNAVYEDRDALGVKTAIKESSTPAENKPKPGIDDLFASGDRVHVKDLPVGSTLDYDLYDLRGQLLIARDVPISGQIIESLRRRQITVVSLGPPDRPTQTSTVREATLLRGRPGRKFYATLAQSNINANISMVAKQVALDSLKKAFHDLGPDTAIDLDDVRETSEDIIEDLVGDEVTTLSIIDMYLLDSSLYHHSINATAIFTTICRALNLPTDRVRAYGTAVMLHDIGRVLLRKLAAGKVPSKRDVDRLHTEAAYKYLKGLGGMEMGPLSAVRNHHERFDGRGYPRGVDVKELGDYGQALILANYYDKVTWDRDREVKGNFHQAANFIIQLSRKLVDTHIITAFLNVFGHHPPGSWVQLSSGEAGMVVQATPFKPRRPKVQIYFDKDGETLTEVISLDLAIQGMPVVLGPYRQLNGDAMPATISNGV